MQPHSEAGAPPLQESPALAAADAALEQGLDRGAPSAPAHKDAIDGLEDDDDDDDWAEGEEVGDADLEGDIDLGDDDEDL